MKLLLLLGLALGARPALGQFVIHTLDSSTLPAEIRYTGRLLNAVQWRDSLGDNIVLTTETGFQQSADAPDDSYRDAAIYAYHYLDEDGEYKLTWKVADNIHECALELKANFVPNTFAVTDLDHNGTAEVWMMYKVACQGGISPVPMRIVMYEGEKRYVVKGTSKVPAVGGGWEGGAYALDEAFRQAPGSFRAYAGSLWKAHLKETLE